MGHPGVHNVINHDADERYPRAARQPGEGISMISRRVQIATLGVVTGVFVVSGGVTGVALAEAHGNNLPAAASPCASRPAAATLVSLVTTDHPAPAADTPTPTPAPTDSSVATTAPPPTSAPPPTTPPPTTPPPEPGDRT
jgi:hypothetical protein